MQEIDITIKHNEKEYFFFLLFFPEIENHYLLTIYFK